MEDIQFIASQAEKFWFDSRQRQETSVFSEDFTRNKLSSEPLLRRKLKVKIVAVLAL